MIRYRRACLSSAFYCLCAAAGCAAWAQAPAPPTQPAQQQQPAPDQQKKPPAQNPFETVPQGQEPPKPQQPPAPQAPFETPKATEVPKAPVGQVIEAIDFKGARRVAPDQLRALIDSKKGDIYDEEALRRDFMHLWNSGRFDDITLQTEPGANGGVIVTFVIAERRVVRSIKYEGAKSVTVSEILDRFKERKVGLSVESQYDPNKVKRAAVVLKEFLAERGRQFATVDPEVRQVPPASLEIVFNVNEGPKVKVGKITILNNQAFTQQEVIRAMKNLHPYGIPYSILFENMFARTYDSSKLEEDKSRVQDFYQQHGYFVARATDSSVRVYDVPPGTGINIPLIHSTKGGKKADISVTVEEGLKYHLHAITFTGVHFF